MQKVRAGKVLSEKIEKVNENCDKSNSLVRNVDDHFKIEGKMELYVSKVVKNWIENF